MKKQLSLIPLLLAAYFSTSTALADTQQGTFAAPKIEHTASSFDKTLDITRGVFSYTDGAKEVVGTTASIHFVIDKPAKDVWPVFHDFGLWQGDAKISYTGAYGDREGDLEFLLYNDSTLENAYLRNTMPFFVQQLIPEQLIVLHSPLAVWADSKGNKLGFRHEGKNAFVLTEVEGKTIITAAIKHAYHFEGENAKANAAAWVQQKVKKEKAKKSEVWDLFVKKLRELIK